MLLQIDGKLRISYLHEADLCIMAGTYQSDLYYSPTCRPTSLKKMMFPSLTSFVLHSVCYGDSLAVPNLRP